jgi:hypothetical protein
MLLKASKSILTLFKKHFCKNPSKSVNFADFASQIKMTTFSRIFQERKFSRKKKVRLWIRTTLTPWTFFFYWADLHDIYGESNTCYFLDLEKFWKKKRVKNGTVPILVP